VHDLEPGDPLELADVPRDDDVPVRERLGSEQQVAPADERSSALELRANPAMGPGRDLVAVQAIQRAQERRRGSRCRRPTCGPQLQRADRLVQPDGSEGPVVFSARRLLAFPLMFGAMRLLVGQKLPCWWWPLLVVPGSSVV
jgi:hypothetical protein